MELEFFCNLVEGLNEQLLHPFRIERIGKYVVVGGKVGVCVEYHPARKPINAPWGESDWPTCQTNYQVHVARTGSNEVGVWGRDEPKQHTTKTTEVAAFTEVMRILLGDKVESFVEDRMADEQARMMEMLK
jgi:hypothetical protein